MNRMTRDANGSMGELGYGKEKIFISEFSVSSVVYFTGLCNKAKPQPKFTAKNFGGFDKGKPALK